MPPSPELCPQDNSHRHLVQFYGQDENLLITNVRRYLGEGLRRGEGLIVIATAAHLTEFHQQLKEEEAGFEAAVGEGRFVCCDADHTLARFMVDGQPDWERFENTVGTLIRQVKACTASAELRAYGEMVDLLWSAGHTSAAVHLEQFWNKLLDANGFSLLCAYHIDIFGKEFHPAVLNDVLCTHTHVVPGGMNGDLESAVERAVNEVLGHKAEEPMRLMKADIRPCQAIVPAAEASALWLRSNLPAYADEILDRARGYYQASLLASLDGRANRYA